MKKALIFCALLLLLLLPGCERGPKDLWVEELPWDAEWTCLLLGDREPEPEAGKETLRALFAACRWRAEPGEEPEGTAVQIWTGTEEPLRLVVTDTGGVYREGILHTPRGKRGGEKLLAGFAALMDRGLPLYEPPPLTYVCGKEEARAMVCQVSSWNYRTRAGVKLHGEDRADNWQHTDWRSMGLSCPRTETEVRFSFPCREPDKAELLAFCDTGTVPVELRGMAFTPYAGAHAYLLSVHWKRGEQGGYGDGMYVLLVEGACAADLPETEDPTVHLTLLEADARGCSLALENDSPLVYSLGVSFDNSFALSYALFRRTDFGGWEWLEPLRCQRSETATYKPREICSVGLDWSWVHGTLEAGEYALLLIGGMRRDGPGLIGAVFSPLYFTLEGECLPDPPGPPEQVSPPAGLSSSLETLSPHRLVQELKNSGNTVWVIDRNFTLFRREADGSLCFLTPEYAFPADWNRPVYLPRGGTFRVSTELAAAYRELEAGDYVLRRRLYLPDEEELEDWPDMSALDRTWRTLPEERVRYLDTPFTLDAPLSRTSLEADPLIGMYWPEYVPEEDPPLTVQAGTFTAEGGSLRLYNPSENTIVLMYEYLYFREGEEWLPLARRIHSWMRLIPADILPAGETREVELAFWPGWPTLPPGTYRLTILLNDHTGEDHWAAAEFVIREDGTGELG